MSASFVGIHLDASLLENWWPSNTNDRRTYEQKHGRIPTDTTLSWQIFNSDQHPGEFFLILYMAVLKNVTSSNLTVAYFLGNGWKLNRWTTNQILFRDEIMSHTTQMSLGFLFATVFDVRCPTGICHWDLEAAGIAEAEFLGDPGRWVPQSRVKGMEDLYQSDS